FLKWAYDAWPKDPLCDNAHAYFESGDMFFVYPGDYEQEKTGVRTSPRFEMLAEAIRDVTKLRQIARSSHRLSASVEELLGSVKYFYGTGINNGVGSAGFLSGEETVKQALAEEVRRLHSEAEKIARLYEKEMQEKEFMNRIGLSSAAQEQVLSFEISDESYAEWKELCYRHKDLFREKIAKETNSALTILCLYVRFAMDLKSEYQAREISDQIYYDTFTDIAIWCSSCEKKTGSAGLEDWEWIRIHLTMGLFRLGRLQYEPETNGTVIHVHVPEGDHLTTESCEASFALADRFFDDRYTRYDCSSWLLSEHLKECLPPDSGIMQFQGCWEQIELSLHSRQAEERIYGTLLDDASGYEESTSLQRRMKTYLLANGNPGIGYGIRERKGEKQSHE
ncbi:MAG: acyltransferase domain-containing protein, partial [Lachnospiraceae bacterium]|nr:acyltransferase domain-containing protein [Lachnospiraceae bacterium]